MDLIAPVGRILAAAGSAEPPIPPTLLYNEGWLLRLALDAEARGTPCLPFRLQPGARWFSEALLYSAFLARHRGDPLAESCTHADGVAGHFSIHPETKAGLTLLPSATQFAVIEAKIFSPLSSGTTRAPHFDQAARNVSCMAETLRRCGRPPGEFSHLGFYVFAPAERIGSGVFGSALNRESITARVHARIAAYDGDSRRSLEVWFTNWVLPLLAALEIRAVAWEEVIVPASPKYAEFYRLCLKHNAPARAAATCAG